MFASSLFLLFGSIAVIAALGMLISRNPVTSALWLILVMCSIAGLYMTLNAEFIAVIQVLVYAGAIMVLFLFVVMLLNLAALPKLGEIGWSHAVGCLLGIVVLVQLVTIGVTGPVEPADAIDRAATGGSAMEIARELFTRYALAFEMVGVLLLVATVGAVMLAQRKFV